MVIKVPETRDWTYVDDILDGLLSMGIKEEAVGEAINLGSGNEHRVIDLANMVNELTGNEAGIKNSNKMGNWENIERSFSGKAWMS